MISVEIKDRLEYFQDIWKMIDYISENLSFEAGGILRENISELEDERNWLENENKKLECENSSLEKMMEDLEDENHNLRIQIKNLEDERRQKNV